MLVALPGPISLVTRITPFPLRIFPLLCKMGIKIGPSPLWCWALFNGMFYAVTGLAVS